MKTEQKPEEICCPEFNPEPWDGKMLEWRNKPFVKAKVFTLYHMPVNFGAVMRKLNSKVEAAQASVPDWLCLSDHTSKWNMDLYLAVDKEVQGAENTTISGKFFSKVYEGPYKDAGKWARDFSAVVKSLDMQMKKQYTWYTTCPKCARKYGKNYVVMMAELG